MRSIYGIFWLVVFSFPIILAGQDSKSCKLLDSETNEPVAYASISAGSTFIYSDLNGTFPLINLPDTILNISRLGYKSLTIGKADLSNVVLMNPSPYSLNEVVVSSNPNVFEAGYTRFKTTGKAVLSKKTSRGVFIENPGRNSRIVNVLVDTRKNQKGDVYDINFFKVNANGEPQDLFFSKEYTSLSNGNGLKINVEDANLSIPLEGIIVSIDWKGNTEKHPDKEFVFLKLTHHFTESYSYIFFQNIWGKLDMDELDFKLNYKIGLEIRPESGVKK